MRVYCLSIRKRDGINFQLGVKKENSLFYDIVNGQSPDYLQDLLPITVGQTNNYNLNKILLDFFTWLDMNSIFMKLYVTWLMKNIIFNKTECFVGRNTSDHACQTFCSKSNCETMYHWFFLLEITVAKIMNNLNVCSAHSYLYPRFRCK
jgi:hypothetical protein